MLLRNIDPAGPAFDELVWSHTPVRNVAVPQGVRLAPADNALKKDLEDVQVSKKRFAFQKDSERLGFGVECHDGNPASVVYGGICDVLNANDALCKVVCLKRFGKLEHNLGSHGRRNVPNVSSVVRQSGRSVVAAVCRGRAARIKI